MRWLALLALLPSLALAQGPRITDGLGTYQTGPRILGESTLAFELDALSQDEASRSGWPVTTTRASARWCETWSGWQSVGNGVPCIGKAGLASFGAGMNYLANSTDFSLWSIQSGITRTQNGDGSWRFCYPSGANGLFATEASVAYAGFASADPMTATIEARLVSGVNSLQINLEGGGSAIVRTPTTNWQRLSASGTKASGTSRLFLNALASAGGCIELRQAQLEKSPTPGPRHDCAGAACSWSADQHTVSTAGWPTSSGRIDLQYTPHSAITASSYLLDGRSASAPTGGVHVLIFSDGRLGAVAPALGAYSTALTWTAGQTYSISVQWSGGVARVFRDGTQVALSDSFAPTAWGATASVGNRYTGGDQANGHIRLVRVSQ